MSTLYSGTITTAGTVISGTVTNLQDKIINALGAVFTYGSSGTTAKAFVQTSFDDGANWHDVTVFSFTTASAQKGATLGWPTLGTAHYVVTDGSLADNAMSGAPIGNMVRCKVISVGTYAGTTTLVVSADVKRL